MWWPRWPTPCAWLDGGIPLFPFSKKKATPCHPERRRREGSASPACPPVIANEKQIPRIYLRHRSLPLPPRQHAQRSIDRRRIVDHAVLHHEIGVPDVRDI